MRLKLFSLIIFIVLFWVVGVASAGVITPPLADDPSLVLRLSFDDYKFYHFGFEQTLQDDTETLSFTSSGTIYYFQDWKTDGQYSVYAAESASSTYISINAPFDAVVIFDIYIPSQAGNGAFKIIVGGNVVKTYTTTGEYKNQVVKVPSGQEIKFLWDGGTASSDAIACYLDNVRISKIINDESGNGNKGEVYGANLTVGRYGYALSFDGEDDYVEVSDSESLHFNQSNSFTISFWLYLKEHNRTQYFVEKYSSDKGFEVHLYGGNNWIYSSIGDGTNTARVRTLEEIPLNVWIYIVVTYDGSKLRIYKDAVLKDETDVAFTIDDSTQNLFVGCTDGAGGFANAIIDEVRIYNRALSGEEIRQMYEALRVKFYDESTGEKIKANATIFNANHSITLPVDDITKEAVLFHADVPEYGLYTIKVAKDGYYTRYYVTELEKEKLVEKSVAILSQNEPSVLLTFKLNDIYNLYDNPILIITKVINNGKYEIFSDTFDVESKASVALQFNGKYFISVWDPANAVERSFGEITAVESTTKVINVFPNAISDTPLNVTYSIQDAGDKIVVNYNDTEYKTQKIVVRIYNQSGSLVYEDSSTANDYALAFVKPDSSRYYTVVLNITRDNVTFERRQIVGNVTGLLQDVFNLLPGENVTGYNKDFFMTLLSFGGLICLAGLFSKRNSRTGALAFAIGAGLVWIFGWLPVSSAVIALIVVMAILGKLEEGYKK